MGADSPSRDLTAARVVATAVGDARVRLTPAVGRPRALLVLGHGAGGGIEAPDLVAVHDRAVVSGLAVALVEQPYRVAGRRAPAPARQLDLAFVAIVAALRADPAYAATPVVTGGRSAGARVACRTTAAARAAAVVALAFPLHPPGRPDRTRAGELTAAGVPVLVVQGERDPFGRPAEFPPGTDVYVVPDGDHSLRSRADRFAPAVVEWALAQARATSGAPSTPTSDPT